MEGIAQVMNWVAVGNLSDIQPRGSRRVIIGDRRIALFRTIRDEVFALRDQCPHKAGPLSEGIIHDNCVTCPLHNWVISLETGEAQGADVGSTPCYQVKLEDGAIYINLEPHNG